jgi:hypothetical protein
MPAAGAAAAAPPGGTAETAGGEEPAAAPAVAESVPSLAGKAGAGVVRRLKADAYETSVLGTCIGVTLGSSQSLPTGHPAWQNKKLKP